ncbi:putative N6-adenine methyltransferase-domain-containing protein [Rhodotorula diobovata]|uniref:Putative N6-adenine methyltransferase-domain-containing protein n=1 Tax=Rhodotorula diobovata TaxID=5288 RepID=A0A5C5FM21_9BASI|nr:putative N6-adenine methyltransferase-domain-containing protein [Rhodotorula diobovata]
MSSIAPQPSTERASASPPRSRSPSPALQLDPSTLAALSAFYDEQAEAERQFQELEKKAHERLEKAREGDAAAADDRMMSVDEFRTLMKEDWQLSQFWYSADFASRFARFLYAHCTSSTRIAFLSCPTAYVGFQHENPLREAFLFEYDARFGLVAGDKFVKYDLEEPLEFPEALKGKVDIAIADPPFLNETTNRYFAETLNALLRPEGKLVLLTSTSTRPFLPSVYISPPAGPLHRTDFRVEHAGSRLQNEFGVWTSWEWEGEVEGVRCEGREEGA